MTFIDTVGEEAAPPALAGHYAADRAAGGEVRNYTRAFSHRPDVYGAWRELSATLQSGMDPRRYELATLAAANRLRSSYCMLAHGTLLADRFMDPDGVRAIARDHRSAGLDERDVAIMDLADKVAGDATTVTQADADRLAALGLSDREVFEVVAAAALRSFFSKLLDGLGVEPDASYAALEPAFRDALTVGRPIAAS